MSAIKDPKTRETLKRRARVVQARSGLPWWLSWTIVAEAHLAGIPTSLGMALLETESGFRNVFGHDPTRAIPRSWMGQKVTEARYLVYKANRKRGLGMQGVGFGQLTWWETQDLADRNGGCWKASVNIRVSFRTLAARIKTYGYAIGVARYNGSGAAAANYSRTVRARARVWHARLTR